MFSTKKLALAALTALSLGVGSAMAQEGPTVEAPNDWAAPPLFQHQAPTHAFLGAPERNAAPQAGAADLGQAGLVNGVDGVSGGGG